MLGKEFVSFERQNQSREPSLDIALEGRSLSAGRRVQDVSFTLPKGSITGFAGLLGAGRTETARLVFGSDKIDKGELMVDGKQRQFDSPAAAINAGIGFLAEDRKTEGIVPEMSVKDNMTLAMLPALTKIGARIDREQQLAIVNRYIKELSIKCHSPDQAIKELSGGNQQKVLLGRWLCMNLDILIVDEPTRGIDIGAKAEILKLLRTLSEQGMSLLLISSEVEELLSTADKITVLSDGKSVADFNIDEVTEDKLFAAMAHQ